MTDYEAGKLLKDIADGYFPSFKEMIDMEKTHPKQCLMVAERNILLSNLRHINSRLIKVGNELCKSGGDGSSQSGIVPQTEIIVRCHGG